jgi:hypothetical protein
MRRSLGAGRGGGKGGGEILYKPGDIKGIFGTA